MKKFFKYGNKGFTLIELLVVIAILGTLAAVVVLNVTKFIGEGKDQANATDLANIQTAVAAWVYDQDGSIAAGTITAALAPTNVGPYQFMLSPAKCNYTYDVDGRVTRGTCPP